MGCEWIGEYGKIENHLDFENEKGECQFVAVKCPLSVCCECTILRKDLMTHCEKICKYRQYRQFTCKYCGFISTYKNVTTRHYNDCINFPMQCPNRCSRMTYLRCQLKGHIAQCPEQNVPCTFSEMGCIEPVKRQLLQKHLESNVILHQTIMCQTVAEQMQKLKLQNAAVKSLGKGNRNLQGTVHQLMQGHCILQNTLQGLDEDKRELEKNVCQLTKEVATLKNPSTGHWIKNMKLAVSKLKLSNWPLYLSKMVEITVIEAITPVIFKVSLTITKELCPNRYRAGDCHSNHYSAPSYCSPPFYSHHNGYKLCLLVKVVCHCPCCCKDRRCLNHSGQLTYEDLLLSSYCERPIYAHNKTPDEDYLSLSVELSVMRGEYDIQLKWPFEKCITVTLLNEKSSNDHTSIKSDYIGRNACSQLAIKLSPGKKSQQVGLVKHMVPAHDTRDSKRNKHSIDRFMYIPSSNICQANPEISDEQRLQKIQGAYILANPNCLLFSLNSGYVHKYVDKKPPRHLIELMEDKYIGECDFNFYLQITM